MKKTAEKRLVNAKLLELKIFRKRQIESKKIYARHKNKLARNDTDCSELFY